MRNIKYILWGEAYSNWLEYSHDESSEFVHIWSNLRAWLNVDIGLDDDEYYIYHDHPLWIYFRNGYEDTAEWLPLVVTKYRCYIPLFDPTINITDSDFREISEFSKKHYDAIKQLADREISFTDFCNIVRANNQSNPG